MSTGAARSFLPKPQGAAGSGEQVARLPEPGSGAARPVGAARGGRAEGRRRRRHAVRLGTGGCHGHHFQQEECAKHHEGQRRCRPRFCGARVGVVGVRGPRGNGAERPGTCVCPRWASPAAGIAARQGTTGHSPSEAERVRTRPCANSSQASTEGFVYRPCADVTPLAQLSWSGSVSDLKSGGGPAHDRARGTGGQCRGLAPPVVGVNPRPDGLPRGGRDPGRRRGRPDGGPATHRQPPGEHREREEQEQKGHGYFIGTSRAGLDRTPVCFDGRR